MTSIDYSALARHWQQLVNVKQKRPHSFQEGSNWSIFKFGRTAHLPAWPVDPVRG
jgi:hypothetical protein